MWIASVHGFNFLMNINGLCRMSAGNLDDILQLHERMYEFPKPRREDGEQNGGIIVIQLVSRKATNFRCFNDIFLEHVKQVQICDMNGVKIVLLK